MNYRPLRVSKLIKEELGELLLKNLEFPGVLVTITDVNVSSKLDIARVELSVLPVDATKKVFKAVNAAQKELQYLLLKKINIKPMPQIMFEVDHGAENAAKVEKLLIQDNNK
ncbi:MAG: ribosome-binding factor A [Patescibacteria group bacterium]|nr:ribosome-binding factor A [Patescibacteria group bacterium]MDE2015324.1 ribosome-binding factor A [Patescibacteria group bacterium]MDE2227129.1 ribosome-binding factor A [Patescibacteria group bacterium]